MVTVNENLETNKCTGVQTLHHITTSELHYANCSSKHQKMAGRRTPEEL
jgi:hypothetical protein